MHMYYYTHIYVPRCVSSPSPLLQRCRSAGGGCVFLYPCCTRLGGAGLVLPRFGLGSEVTGLASRFPSSGFVWCGVGFPHFPGAASFPLSLFVTLYVYRERRKKRPASRKQS
jgi:hypothetical protein